MNSTTDLSQHISGRCDNSNGSAGSGDQSPDELFSKTTGGNSGSSQGPKNTQSIKRENTGSAWSNEIETDEPRCLPN